MAELDISSQSFAVTEGENGQYIIANNFHPTQGGYNTRTTFLNGLGIIQKNLAHNTCEQEGTSGVLAFDNKILEMYNKDCDVFGGAIKQYDLEGNLDYDIFIDPKSDRLFLYDLIRSDKTFQVVGSIKIPNNAVIISFDFGGNELWRRELNFGGVKTDVFMSVSKTKTGGFLVSGRTFDREDGDWDMCFAKLDFEGNIIWEKTMDLEEYKDSEETAESIVELDNGNIAIGVVFGHRFNVDSLGLRSDRFGLLILDSMGTKISFNTYFEDMYRTYLYDMVLVKNSNEMVFMVNMNSDRNFATENQILKLLKINQEGEIVWERDLGDTENISRIGLVLSETSDKGFLIGGHWLEFNEKEERIGPQYVLAIKTDNCGCLVPNCDPNCKTIIAEVDSELATITQISDPYPNPTKNIININYSLSKNDVVRVAFTNYLGHLVNDYTVSETGTVTYDFSQQAKGMYVYTIKDLSNTVIKSGKLVIN